MLILMNAQVSVTWTVGMTAVAHNVSVRPGTVLLMPLHATLWVSVFVCPTIINVCCLDDGSDLQCLCQIGYRLKWPSNIYLRQIETHHRNYCAATWTSYLNRDRPLLYIVRIEEIQLI